MMIDNELNNTPVRHIVGKAELFNGSALLSTFSHSDKLIGFDVERVGDEAKFYGFGVFQKAKIKLLDIRREISLTTDNSFKLYINNSDTYPHFHITEVNRDENTNALSITAYDRLHTAAEHYTNEIPLSGYTIAEYAAAAADVLGLSIAFVGFPAEDYTLAIGYDNGANFEGTETIKEALDYIAEATLSIYYLDSSNTLVFRRLDKDGSAAYTIDKEQYIKLDSKTNRRLAAIAHITELGDNVEAALEVSGTKQYIRDNPFYELREDIAEIVNNALSVMGGFTIHQFSCDWRGNYGLEIGDKIALITKDNATVYSYVINDTISYDGGLSETTKWEYSGSDTETATNPSTIGEAIKKTYARVDKVNKQIDLVVSETTANKEDISNIYLDTESIVAAVSKIQTDTTEAISGINGELAEINNKVSAAITAEDVSIAIETELSNGVDKVITSTGFVFDETGLSVSKSDSEMNTTITEDGMKVFRSGEEVLKADNSGVYATNLHSRTYLIVGTYSRFEDFEAEKGSRTGCFWIGAGGEDY